MAKEKKFKHFDVTFSIAGSCRQTIHLTAPMTASALQKALNEGRICTTIDNAGPVIGPNPRQLVGIAQDNRDELEYSDFEVTNGQ